MPVTGIPDPARHKTCFRCRKRHEPEEGSMVDRAETGPYGDFRRAFEGLAGMPRERFMCFRCQRVRAATKLVLWVLFALAVCAALVIGWLKEGRL